jgi:hypothetical protein
MELTQCEQSKVQLVGEYLSFVFVRLPELRYLGSIVVLGGSLIFQRIVDFGYFKNLKESPSHTTIYITRSIT